MPTRSSTARSTLFWSSLLVLCALFASVAAQSSTSSGSQSATNSNQATPTPTTYTTSTTVLATISTTLHNGTSLIPTVTDIPVVVNLTVTSTPPVSSPSSTANATSAAASATASADPSHLDTKIDPGFGVLGAILILTGLPSAFLGHKNRWTSFFLIGFYTLSLVCLVLILKFGVLQAVNPPSTTLRGLFVLACCVAGIAGGAVSIFFWKATRYFIGAWGGFAFALWIQCFRNGGLIHPIGFRWILYIACAVVGFLLCAIPKIHYQIILVSTAFVGATAFMLGVDCYTTTNLKEFYMWNLGFTSLFPRYESLGIQFPVSQTMEIELGLEGAVALMGIAMQLRLYKILRRKLKEIKDESRRQDADAEARAAARFGDLDHEKAEWEREHPSLPKHGRQDSTFSASPLIKEDGSTDEKRASTNTLVSPIRQRYQSGVSSFMATPLDGRQSPGALPALDLGTDLETNVPQNYISDVSGEGPSEPRGLGIRARTPSVTLTSAQELEDLKKKQELLSEIQNIRKSIELLKAETPAPSSSSESRNPSFGSRRTQSQDLGSFSIAGPSTAHLRDPRARVQSMDLTNMTRSEFGNTIGRPTSVPLQDEDWDAYVRERKLLQPPSGVTPPIPTTPLSPTPRVPVSPAVADALFQRQRRESSLSFGMMPAAEERDRPPSRDRNAPPHHSPEEIPIALRPQHKKTDSQDSYAPGVLLPPRHRQGASSPPPPLSDAPRVMSFEELNERHKEKLRQLQQPLTESEKEQADVLVARARWERAKEAEKKAVLKRQAEQAAVVESKKKERSRRSLDASAALNEAGGRAGGHGHSRSLSADVLATVPGAQPASSKRMSTMKVQDWQRHQMEDEVEQALEHPERAEREASGRRHGGVPFPGATAPRPRAPRESRRQSTVPRDPLT
ncbi:hypothetical protein EIP86_010483 [Pleurotus ostreatoroseus]|nr:hypothetical protein EIP86_010483 [Pleurotus ostreatoroseus]